MSPDEEIPAVRGTHTRSNGKKSMKTEQFTLGFSRLAIMLIAVFSPISAKAAELIVNSGFESGSTGWTMSGASSSANGGFARSGTQFCWLGGAVSHTDLAYQDIT